MKAKTSILIFLIFLYVLSYTLANNEGQEETKIYVDPPSVTADPGGTFTVNIKVANVKNLYTYQFYLSWEPTLLNLTRITEGPFLNSENTHKTSFNPRIYNTPDPFNVSGYVYVACTLLGEPATAAANGDGTLATIEFLVKGEGKTPLHLYKTKLLNPMINEMPHVTEDGEYHFEYPIAVEISVQPSIIVNTSLIPDNTFSINISIIQAVDIYAWSLNMKWDPALLNVTKVEEGSFLNRAAYNTVFTIHIDQEKGNLYANCTLFEEPPGVLASGNGTLMSITFHVEALGITVLDLYDTKLIGYGGIEVSHITKDGYFKNLSRDISIISVEVSPDEVKAGDSVSVTVIVKNKGNVPENFDITVYWNDSNFGTLSVSDLNPEAEKTLTFSWSGKSVAEGNYTIKAVTDTVLWETETADNTYINGYIVVKPSEQATLLIPLEVIYVIILAVIGGAITGFIFLRKRRS